MTAPATASEDFLAVFRAAAASTGTLAFDRFMTLALYDPRVGYYSRSRPRVGYAAGTDFFTASTSGPVFGELVTAAAVNLLGRDNPADFTFVEIGAESPAGILAAVAHPFGAVRTIRLGQPIELDGRCIVFSNELFDAQPFRRFVLRDGAWRELGVSARDGMLIETEFPPAAPVPSELPAVASEGYVFDAPLAARALAGTIAAQPWTGLFLACDYGKSWLELSAHTPAGTARAYHRHTQSSRLLDHPGEQDLTCHICWDWIVTALDQHHFADATIESQEAFFVRHAASYIASVSTADATRFSPRKLSLLQLLHPSHLGQKFQVLHARR